MVGSVACGPPSAGLAHRRSAMVTTAGDRWRQDALTPRYAWASDAPGSYGYGMATDSGTGSDPTLRLCPSCPEVSLPQHDTARDELSEHAEPDPADTASEPPEIPLTCAGDVLSSVVPSPSVPYMLCPQHSTPPVS